MISFRQYLVREGRGDLKDRLSKHVKHSNDCKALLTAFPDDKARKPLDKAMKLIYDKWKGKGSKPEERQRSSLSKFIADDDRKWAKLWGAVRADAE